MAKNLYIRQHFSNQLRETKHDYKRKIEGGFSSLAILEISCDHYSEVNEKVKKIRPERYFNSKLVFRLPDLFTS